MDFSKIDEPLIRLGRHESLPLTLDSVISPAIQVCLGLGIPMGVSLT